MDSNLQPTQNPSPSPQPATAPTQPSPLHHSSKKWMLVGITLLIIVVVAGGLLYILTTQNAQSTEQAAIPTTVSSPSPTEVSVATKSFSNDSLIFSYPSDWTVGENNHGQSLYPFQKQIYLRPTKMTTQDPEYGVITISIISSGKSSFDEMMKSECERTDCTKAEEISISGHPAKRLDNVAGALPADIIWFDNKGVLYRFLLIKNTEGTSDYSQVFDEVITSFRFLESNNEGA